MKTFACTGDKLVASFCIPYFCVYYVKNLLIERANRLNHLLGISYKFGSHGQSLLEFFYRGIIQEALTSIIQHHAWQQDQVTQVSVLFKGCQYVLAAE